MLTTSIIINAVKKNCQYLPSLGLLLVSTLLSNNLSAQEYDITPCSDVIEYKGEAYFCGLHHEKGRELFRSNGTREGTHVVKDIDVGPGSSDPQSFFKMNGLLYFFAETALTGNELYVTDGSQEFTKLIRDTIAGPQGQPNYMRDGGTILGSDKEKFILGLDSAIWRTDGTYAGTNMLVPPSQESDSVSMIGYSNGNLVYAQGNQIFKIESGGNTGVLVKSFDTGCNVRRLEYSLTKSEPLFLRVYCPNEPSISEFTAWVTDGSTIGTQKIPGFATGIVIYGGELNGRYYYNVLCHRIEGCAESLVHTDGYSTTTIIQGEQRLSTGISAGGVNYNNELVFTWNGDTWTTDGTIENTKAITDINTGNQFSTTNRQHGWAKAGGKLIFFQSDKAGFPDALNRNELWVSNGNALGARKLLSFGAESSLWSGLTIGNNHYFFVQRNEDIQELWVTNATLAGTKLLSAFQSNDYSNPPRSFAEGSRFYFRGSNRLWHSDGTVDGTFKLTYGTEILSQPENSHFLTLLLYLLLEDDE